MQKLQSIEKLMPAKEWLKLVKFLSKRFRFCKLLGPSSPQGCPRWSRPSHPSGCQVQSWSSKLGLSARIAGLCTSLAPLICNQMAFPAAHQKAELHSLSWSEAVGQCKAGRAWCLVFKQASSSQSLQGWRPGTLGYATCRKSRLSQTLRNQAAAASGFLF